MGERAYFIWKDPENGQWKAVYSHWGAYELEKYLYSYVKALMNKQSPKEAFRTLREQIEILIESEKEKEKVITIKEPWDFIDYKDIIIEAWVILGRSGIAIYAPAITYPEAKAGRCLVIRELDEPDTLIDAVTYFMTKARVIAKFLSRALNKGIITSDQAIEMIRAYHEDYMARYLYYSDVVVVSSEKGLSKAKDMLKYIDYYVLIA